jgi:hypothetical protein
VRRNGLLSDRPSLEVARVEPAGGTAHDAVSVCVSPYGVYAKRLMTFPAVTPDTPVAAMIAAVFQLASCKA